MEDTTSNRTTSYKDSHMKKQEGSPVMNKFINLSPYVRSRHLNHFSLNSNLNQEVKNDRPNNNIINVNLFFQNDQKNRFTNPFLDNSITSEKFLLEKKQGDSFFTKDSGRISIIKPARRMKSIGIEKDNIADRNIGKVDFAHGHRRTVFDTYKHSESRSLVSQISQNVRTSMKQTNILQKNPKKFIYEEFKSIFQKHLEFEKQQYEDLISKLDSLFDHIERQRSDK
jgi:hypothetical protein